MLALTWSLRNGHLQIWRVFCGRYWGALLITWRTRLSSFGLCPLSVLGRMTRSSDLISLFERYSSNRPVRRQWHLSYPEPLTIILFLSFSLLLLSQFHISLSNYLFILFSLYNLQHPNFILLLFTSSPDKYFILIHFNFLFSLSQPPPFLLTTFSHPPAALCITETS